jgi:transposase
MLSRTVGVIVPVEPAMPAAHACQIVLAAGDRHRLKRLERSQTAPYRQVLRAKIGLLAAHGVSNATIAAGLGVTVDTARKWRGRFAALGMDGLAGRPRPGRPPRFTPVQVAEVKALACQLPAEQGVPLSVWSCPELAREAVTRGITAAVSASTVRRWLAEDAIKPWQHRSWIFIRDPDFRAKASRVLELYAGRWRGQPLGPDDYVISSDEKTSIQARCRCHPTLPPGKARMMRVNHDHDRGGALAYLAAYDTGRARVFGHCAPSTGITPFMALVTQVMTQEPYASATRVCWIVDNGSSHRGNTAIDRLAKRFPNASPSWSTPPPTPPGSTGSRSTSRWCSARSWHPTTSPTSTRSDSDWPTSSSATTPPPSPLGGSSPQPTWTTCSPGSTGTGRPPDRPSRRPHDQPSTNFRRRPRC